MIIIADFSRSIMGKGSQGNTTASNRNTRSSRFRIFLKRASSWRVASQGRTKSFKANAVVDIPYNLYDPELATRVTAMDKSR